MEEIMWTLDYEADIESDLSAFHRVDDISTMDAPRYFRLATRLPAYSGVLAARAAALREDERSGRSGAPGAGGTAERPSVVADDTALAMLAVDGWAEHVTETPDVVESS